MKRIYWLAIFLFVLAGFAGYLLSRASLVGRVGISLFYTQYKFLRVWWQAGAVILSVWVLLFFLHRWLAKRIAEKRQKTIHLAAILLAALGLYFTNQDFQHTLSHRLLGTKFHVGAYLFWMGWIGISLYYMTDKKPTTASRPRTNDNTGRTEFF
jgi:hypothetical protein